jgi:hypothetical protein
MGMSWWMCGFSTVIVPGLLCSGTAHPQIRLAYMATPEEKWMKSTPYINWYSTSTGTRLTWGYAKREIACLSLAS